MVEVRAVATAVATAAAATAAATAVVEMGVVGRVHDPEGRAAVKAVGVKAVAATVVAREVARAEAKAAEARAVGSEVAYHRGVGVLVFVTLSLHMFVWWGKWGNEGTLNSNIVAYNTLAVSPERVTESDWTVPTSELAWLLLAVSVGLAAVGRRAAYAWFRPVHVYAGTVYYVAALFHAWSFW